MNRFSKRINALMCVTIMAYACTYASDSEPMIPEQQELIETQEQVVWYKNKSNQCIATGVIITAAIAYAIAVRMGKVPSPMTLLAGFAGLFSATAKAKSNDAGKVADNTVTPFSDQSQNPGDNGMKKEENLPKDSDKNELEDRSFSDQAKALINNGKNYAQSLFASINVTQSFGKPLADMHDVAQQ